MQTLLKTTRAYRLLQAETQNDRCSHAYLLQMDDARNLRTVLKEFAKLFFHCAEPTTDKGRNLARRIDEENFTDCLFYPDADKKFVVDDAERLTEESLLKPVEGDKKVFVVCDFAEANAASQNKLLKLLEEPPENVVFLLGATSSYPVLSTVLSRVAKLEIPPFNEREIEGALRRIYTQSNYTEKDFELVAASCSGSLGTAQNMLEGGEYKTLLENAFSLCLATGATLPALVKKIGETPYKKQLLFLLRLIYRDALVLKTQNRTDTLLLRSQKERILEVADKYLISSLVFAQKTITQAEKDIAFNAVFPQCLEITLSKILLQNAKDLRKNGKKL